MSLIFEALPGIEVPVSAISKSLSQMWAESAAHGRPAPEADDAKATQLNVVLHLGLNTTPADAAVQFQVISAFSVRYPCRIVVLCPLHTDVPEPVMRAKVYGECHLGKSKSDKRCVEFVMLSYSRSARPHLENQVSVCLSTDLPLYYWAHRFSASGRLADYRYLLGRAKRVLIDSAVAPADALTYPWENPAGLRDLAYSRLLPVRQTIGQFLSAYPPALLLDGLKTVMVGHDASLAAEGRVVSCWLQRRLAACGPLGADVKIALAPLPAESGAGLGVRFEYANPARFFRWSGDVKAGAALFEADFGAGRTTLSAAASLLAPPAALSEAMFF
jgi:glucose-6-phosphate dehydrogenase assembly protein OpcA